MTRSELEHLIRAAVAIADDDQIIVIGSQAGVIPGIRATRRRWPLPMAALGMRRPDRHLRVPLHDAKQCGRRLACSPFWRVFTLTPMRTANS